MKQFGIIAGYEHIVMVSTLLLIGERMDSLILHLGKFRGAESKRTYLWKNLFN